MTATRSAPAVAAPPLLTRKFLAWLGASTVAGTGDGILYFAIGWTAAGLGGQAAGLMLTLVVLPRTFLLLVGGAVGDRLGLRRTVIGCDAAMCLVLGAYLVAERTPVPVALLLAALALALGVVSAFRLPAAGTLPRLFVDDDALPRAMSVTGSVLQVARLIGPPLGGVVVAGLGMTGAVSANLLTFAVILVVLLAVKPPYDRPPAPGVGSPLHQIREGLRAARRIPGVLPLLGAVGLVAASLIPMLSLCVPLVARGRGWSPGATGLIEAAWIVGTLSVTLVVARTGTRARVLLPLTGGPVLASVGVLVIAASPTPVPAMVGALVMGVGTAVFTTHVFPMYVLQTPEGMLARFQALLGVVQAAPMLVANNVLGAVASHATPTGAMVLVAALSALAAVVILASRTLRTAAPVTTNAD